MAKLRFEWDKSKDTANKNKHGVSFDEAVSVFADELARLIPEPDHSVGEERFIILAMSKALRLLIASHCERSSDLIRITSARKADRRERNEYEDFTHA